MKEGELITWSGSLRPERSEMKKGREESGVEGEGAVVVTVVVTA